MKIDRVIYGSTVPTVQFGNQRPGFEASLEPGDDPVEAYKKLHEIAMKAVGEVIGDSFKESSIDKRATFTTTIGGSPTEIPYGPTPTIDLNHQRLRDAIDDCQNAEQLQAWKDKNSAIPVPINNYYNERLKKLTK